MNFDTEVLIIGGGPAGSTLASYLAKNKIKCLVLEKEKFPRHHVGESLVPACNRIFKELDLLSKLEEAKFLKKYGAAWTTPNNNNPYFHDFKHIEYEEHVDIAFGDRKSELFDTESTYHVDRSKFDEILLKHAEEKGAKIKTESYVKEITFHDTHINAEYISNGKEQFVTAKLVADCSGRSTLLGNQLKIKEKDKVMQQIALYSWFENYDRSKFPLTEYIYVHFLPLKHSWIWQIPITDSVTSVGIVTHKDNLDLKNNNWEEQFYKLLEKRPELSKIIKKANRVKPFYIEGDYSYEMKQLCGDRFLLVGDAGRFVDPIFSSGVSIALNSARFASKNIITAIEKNEYSRNSFNEFETIMRNGCKNWYDFIQTYYDLNVLFTYFVSSKEHKMAVLKFLQGDVYETGNHELLNQMILYKEKFKNLQKLN